jgi:hypothetical protein
MPALRYVGYESNPVLLKHAAGILSKYPQATVELGDPKNLTPTTCDLIISRTYLEELSYGDIGRAVVRFSQYDCKFFALGSYSHKASDNRDTQTGTKFLINLEKHPFNMSPAHRTNEGNTNRELFVYTVQQMRGYVKSNAFWTSGIS